MKLSTQIFLGFSVIIGLSFLDSYVNNLLSNQVNRNTAFLANSEVVIRNSSKLHKGIIEMQSAFRGYLLTDDEHFLEPYYRGVKEISAVYLEQKKLVQSSPQQTSRLTSIWNLHQQWINYANSLIEAQKEGTAGANTSSRYSELFESKFR